LKYGFTVCIQKEKFIASKSVEFFQQSALATCLFFKFIGPFIDLQSAYYAINFPDEELQ